MTEPTVAAPSRAAPSHGRGTAFVRDALVAAFLDGAKSISVFLEDIDNAEKTAVQEPGKSRIKLVKEQHPPYAERAQAMQDSYVYWVAQR